MDNSTDMAIEEEMKAAMSRVREHYDVDGMIILWCRTEGTQSRSWKIGCGSWYAQFGMVCDWLNQNTTRKVIEETQR